MAETVKNWKTPNELLKLLRQKQKKKALQNRLTKTEDHLVSTSKQFDDLQESIKNTKRTNPFAKNQSVCKKFKIDSNEQKDEVDSRLFQNVNPVENVPKEEPSYLHLIENRDSNETSTENLAHSELFPIDWSIAVRLRLLSKTQISGNALKTSQEASGLTCYTRCIDLKNCSNGFDTSVGARLFQCSLYWQHPNLPWLTMFPRLSKSNQGFNLGEMERDSLKKDWIESFRGLFQLLRARQCPFFYVCSNSFNALFRAAGIGGKAEMHVFVTPTSVGFRSLLKREDIIYTMPMKQTSPNETKIADQSNTSAMNVSNNEFQMESSTLNPDYDDEEEENIDDDIGEEEWLARLGVEAAEIKKIATAHKRSMIKAESKSDTQLDSVILIEGSDCQAFFNFLLNAKSSIASVGRLAGVPPTLLAPVAFPGATLRRNKMSSNKVHVEGADYFSCELKGVILPNTLQNICKIMKEQNDSFGVTINSFHHTDVLSPADRKSITMTLSDPENNAADVVFGRENLSDCGLSQEVLAGMCRTSEDAVQNIHRLSYNKHLGGYSWN